MTLAPAPATNAVPGAEQTVLPSARPDLAPAALVLVLMLAALPLVGSTSTWVTLSIAGLAMGMMMFIMASGLTLVFGLMNVLNFGHGALVSVGAYAATLVLLPMRHLAEADSLAQNLGVLLLAVLLAVGVTGLLGWAFERVLIAPVYGQHLKQILITMGGMIVAEQLINVLWGAEQIALPLPHALQGAVLLGDAAVEKYRLVAVAVGLAVFALMFLVLNRTRLGLLIRAGVENREMVEAMGYRVKRLFIIVFAAGSALAGLGGVMWGLYKGVLSASIGGETMVVIFIVVIIGGLGSVGGCFIGALLMALAANYAGFLAPKLALVSNIIVMIAILLWRPAGLFSGAQR
ncbi:MAG: branched-chain amino acid ABC transporter permease [Gammaproteobacteria bacterium]